MYGSLKDFMSSDISLFYYIEPLEPEKKEVKVRDRTPSRDRRKKEAEKRRRRTGHCPFSILLTNTNTMLPVYTETHIQFAITSNLKTFQSVVEEGTDSEVVLKTLTIEVEEPPSPASSVISNETDSGSTRGKNRRSRGKVGRPGRRSTRVTTRRSKLSVSSIQVRVNPTYYSLYICNLNNENSY